MADDADRLPAPHGPVRPRQHELDPPTVNTWCDYAQIGCGAITRGVGDGYLEIGFPGGTLAPGASTGDIQLRLAKADWSAFDETNDHSYGTNKTYAETTRVTITTG